MPTALPTKSFIFGVLAFDAGVSCAPTRDKAFWAFVTGEHRDFGEMDGLMSDWCAGWDEANGAEHVPDWTPEENAALERARDPKGARRAKLALARELGKAQA